MVATPPEQSFFKLLWYTMNEVVSGRLVKTVDLGAGEESAILSSSPVVLSQTLPDHTQPAGFGFSAPGELALWSALCPHKMPTVKLQTNWKHRRLEDQLIPRAPHPILGGQ